MTLLEFRAVACDRGGRRLFEALDLAIEPGGAAVVTGPNGAGKSSLIRIAAGLLSASEGRVERGGAAALADESLALDGRLPLRRALAFWAGLDSSTRLARIVPGGGPVSLDAALGAYMAGPDDGLDAMGLAALTGVPVRMLSTGQRKRATLARVVASGAALWLLDEPANGLDAEGQERLEAAMAAHRTKGGAILAASHQPLALPGAKTVALG